MGAGDSAVRRPKFRSRSQKTSRAEAHQGGQSDHVHDERGDRPVPKPKGQETS